jgi:hypothetical protein
MLFHNHARTVKGRLNMTRGGLSRYRWKHSANSTQPLKHQLIKWDPTPAGSVRNERVEAPSAR